MTTNYKIKPGSAILLLDGRIEVEVMFLDKGHPFGDGKWHLYTCAPIDDPETISMDLYRKCKANPKLKKEKPPTKQVLYDRAAAAVREERGRRLAASDWTQLPDVPEETRTLWAQYRLELRDITRQRGFPHSIKWPEAPG